MKQFMLRVWGAEAPVSIRRTPKLGGDDGIVVKRGQKFKVYINPKTKGKDRLETVIHEALHLADWSKDEEWVVHSAKGIADLLWAMGYRSDKE